MCLQQFVADFEAEVRSKSKAFVQRTRFGQDFEVEVQAKFWSWSLDSILPLMFCKGYEVNLG